MRVRIVRKDHGVMCQLRHWVGAALWVAAFSGATLSVSEASDLNSRSATGVTGPSSTLLPDGRLMLIGGTSEQGVQSAIRFQQGELNEAFPVTLKFARTGHTATVLPSGKILVFGGTGPDDRLVNSAELIDPVEGTTEEVPLTGLIPRTQHSATLLTHGEVLIAGGQDGDGNALSSVQLWDPRTGVVQSSGTGLQIARFAHEAALLASGEGLIWGGQVNASESAKTGEIYNPDTKLFEAPIEQSDARVSGVATAAGEAPSV
jgi:hypothetical protein